MSEVLRQYEENGYQITEFTRDGVTVSTIIKELIPVESLEPAEPIEPSETLEQKVTRLEEKIEQFNLINTDISLTVYEEILALREELASLKGTSENA